MIKRANNKKKKGFTLIELIIVLAVMAIIALIAIPNFAAVRNNSKVKADKQSCETIEREVLMLVSDETIKTGGTAVISFNDDKTFKDVKGGTGTALDADGIKLLEEQFKTLKKPQSKDTYVITIDVNDVTVEVDVK